LQPKTNDTVSEAELITRAIYKDESAVRIIIQRHNRRLYRVARSVLRDEGEAEDVVQDAYIRAFSALPEFRAESSLATWLSRIVLNETLQRARRQGRHLTAGTELRQMSEAQIIPFPVSSNSEDPERMAAQREFYRLLEYEIDKLPEEFRLVLMARVIEDMSIEETAELLGLQPATVKTRLHRARCLLKGALTEHIGPLFSDVFPFEGTRCERMIAGVLERLNLRS
jgi:RNA polymerase sigma-70 factor (ECF subfamily)